MKRNYSSTWLPLVAGILLIVAGISAFFMPRFFTGVLIYVISFSILLNGIITLVFYVKNRHSYYNPISTLFTALLEIVLGVLFLFAGATTVGTAFSYVLGIWLLLQTLVHIVGAVYLKKAGFSHWWFPIIVAISSLILGIISLINPVSTLLALGLIVGIQLLINGIVKVVSFFTYR